MTTKTAKAEIVKYAILLVAAVIIYFIPKDDSLSNVSAILISTIVGGISGMGAEIAKGRVLKHYDIPYISKIKKNILIGAIGALLISLFSAFI